MDLEKIGLATKRTNEQSMVNVGEFIGNSDYERDVIFPVPYGEATYIVSLKDEEMDKVLKHGFECLLGNQALTGFGFTIELEEPDLPLYAGARSILTAATESGLQTVNLNMNVVTQSVVYEHRGILNASRRRWDGKWTLNSYKPSPPLDSHLASAQKVSAPQ